MSLPGFSIEPLAPHHRRDDFDCGAPALNDYLRKYARQDMDRGAAIAYVAVADAHPSVIAGFYTLAATGVRLQDLPPQTVKKLPRYPLVPATLLGRLAVERLHRGRGLGEGLLLDALRRSLDASAAVGSAAVLVDAKDERSAAFYLRYCFTQFPSQPLRLFLPMKTISLLK